MINRQISGGEPRSALGKRVLLYGVLILVIGCAQCGFFAMLSICPATPDLVLGALVAIALLDSGKVAMVAAIPAGFLMEAIGGSGIALLPLIYLVSVTCIGGIAAKLLPRFLSYAVLMALAALLRSLFTLLQIGMAMEALPSIETIPGLLLPELLCTFILSLPTYPLTKLARIPMTQKGRFSF